MNQTFWYTFWCVMNDSGHENRLRFIDGPNGLFQGNTNILCHFQLLLHQRGIVLSESYQHIGTRFYTHGKMHISNKAGSIKSATIMKLKLCAQFKVTDSSDVFLIWVGGRGGEGRNLMKL